MKTAGVIIDSWKLPIFKKHLEEAGYTYEEQAGVAPKTLTLMVNYGWVADLKPVLEAASAECTKTGELK